MASITNLSAGVQAFTANAFLVEGDRPVLVDTGANFDIVPRIRTHVDALEAIVLTHTHSDHVGNVDAVRDAFGVQTWGYDPDRPAVDNPTADGETVQLGDDEYVAVHTPGHKNDLICLYGETPHTLFAGDLVFQNGSFGRTDLAEGDRASLIESIDRIRSIVGADLEAMYVGHGPDVLEDPASDIDLAARMARSM